MWCIALIIEMRCVCVMHCAFIDARGGYDAESAVCGRIRFAVLGSALYATHVWCTVRCLCIMRAVWLVCLVICVFGL